MPLTNFGALKEMEKQINERFRTNIEIKYPLVSLVGRGTYINCSLPVLGD